MIRQYSYLYRHFRISAGSIAFALLLVAFSLISLNTDSDPIHRHYSYFSEQISSSFDLDDQVSTNHSVLHSLVGKYRKRFKQASDTGISFERFARRLARKFTIPFSVSPYQQPHFSSVVHTFLYRLACF